MNLRLNLKCLFKRVFKPQWVIPLCLVSACRSESHACAPLKTDAMLERMCAATTKIKSSLLTEQLAKQAQNFVYDDCGLSAVILYQPDSPQRLIFHPLRPFIVQDKKIEFANTPKPRNENAFVMLAKRSLETAASTKIATLTKYKTSLGFYTYERDYWSQRCLTKDGKTVLAAAAQTRSKERAFSGSNISGFQYQILQSSQLEKLTNQWDHLESRKSLFLNFSKNTAIENHKHIADVLSLKSEHVLKILMDRLADPDHYVQFQIWTSNQKKLDRLSVIGFLQSDIEHALAIASLPSGFDATNPSKPDF